MLSLCFAMHGLISVLSIFVIILMRKRELFCDCWWSISLPRGAVDWSVVCDSGIFYSYFFLISDFDSC